MGAGGVTHFLWGGGLWGKPYSMDLRERILAYAAGHSCRAAARLVGVSASTAVRLAAAQRERGHIAPKPQGRAPGTTGKLAAHRAFLFGIIWAEPAITLRELAGAPSQRYGGMRVCPTSLP